MNWRLGECYCCCLYFFLLNLHLELQNNSFFFTFQDIKFRDSKIRLMSYVYLYLITYMNFLQYFCRILIRVKRSHLCCNFIFKFLKPKFKVDILFMFCKKLFKFSKYL